MSVVALSELLGATVRDATGAVRGRVREIAVAPQDHPTRIAFLIVKTADGERTLLPGAIQSAGASVRSGMRVGAVVGDADTVVMPSPPRRGGGAARRPRFDE